MEYNLNAIERRLMEKVCYGKAAIVGKLSHFKYRDDVQSAGEFINMKKKVKQVNYDFISIVEFYLIYVVFLGKILKTVLTRLTPLPMAACCWVTTDVPRQMPGNQEKAELHGYQISPKPNHEWD